MKSLFRTKPLTTAILTLSLLTLSGCTKDPSLNHPPKVEIKSSKITAKGEVVQLSAKVTDADKDDELTYQWRLTLRPKGSNASLKTATTKKSSFKADKSGLYQISFAVSDKTIKITKNLNVIVSSLQGEWKVDLAKSKKENKLNEHQTNELIELLSSNYKMTFLENGKVEGDETSSWQNGKNGIYYLKNKKGEKSDIKMITADTISLIKQLPDGTEVTSYYTRVK
jgi:hypothetical protein